MWSENMRALQKIPCLWPLPPGFAYFAADSRQRAVCVPCSAACQSPLVPIWSTCAPKSHEFVFFSDCWVDRFSCSCWSPFQLVSEISLLLVEAQRFLMAEPGAGVTMFGTSVSVRMPSHKPVLIIKLFNFCQVTKRICRYCM